MYLLLDIGNTRIKYAISNGEYFVEEGITSDAELPNIINNRAGVKEVALCATGKITNVMQEAIAGLDSTFKLDASAHLPFTTNYQSNTIGADRLALIAAAHNLYPNHNVLVLDVGTCLTADVVTKEGEHLGGLISPGIDLRLKAMNTFTENLPLVEMPTDLGTDILANSTTTCLQSGAVNGLKLEMHGIISNLKQRFSDLYVVLTGGAKSLLDEVPKNNIFAHDNLCLKGLDVIYTHNKK